MGPIAVSRLTDDQFHRRVIIYYILCVIAAEISFSHFSRLSKHSGERPANWKIRILWDTESGVRGGIFLTGQSRVG